MHELNRQLFVTHWVKSPRTTCDDRFRRPAPLTLSTALHGSIQTVNYCRSRFIFWNEALCTTKSSWKEPLRLATISSAVSVVGELAYFVVAVDSLRPALVNGGMVGRGWHWKEVITLSNDPPVPVLTMMYVLVSMPTPGMATQFFLLQLPC